MYLREVPAGNQKYIINVASRWHADALRCVMWRVGFNWAYTNIRGYFSLMQPVRLRSIVLFYLFY
jgi:hypothetical protein